MDRVVIERKLDSLRRCVFRVRERRPSTLGALLADLDIQDVLVLNLSRAVQLCVDIGAHLLTEGDQPTPSTMGETFTMLAASGVIDDDLAKRLRGAVGFRNIAVHNYEVIDWMIVHKLADTSLQDFADFALQVAARLPS